MNFKKTVEATLKHPLLAFYWSQVRIKDYLLLNPFVSRPFRQLLTIHFFFTSYPVLGATVWAEMTDRPLLKHCCNTERFLLSRGSASSLFHLGMTCLKHLPWEAFRRHPDSDAHTNSTGSFQWVLFTLLQYICLFYVPSSSALRHFHLG